MNDRKFASFSVAKLLLIIFIGAALVASFTFAYYKNKQTYLGGTFSTANFPSNKIIDDE